MLLREPVNDDVLGIVGILVFVDKDVVKPGAVLFEHSGKIAEQDVDVHQQVIEIHGIGLETPCGIMPVDSGHLRHPRGFVGLGDLRYGAVLLCGNEVVLGMRDTRGNGGRLVKGIVEPHLPDDGAYQAPGVVLVVDGEVAFVSQVMTVMSQEARKYGVKGSHPEAPRSFGPHDGAYARLHLSCRLVGKGQGQDPVGGHTLLYQVCHTVGQHPGLAGTGTGNDHRRPFSVDNGGLLCLVKLFEVVAKHQ